MCNLTKVFGSHDLYRMLIFSPALLILAPSAPNSNYFENGKNIYIYVSIYLESLDHIQFFSYLHNTNYMTSIFSCLRSKIFTDNIGQSDNNVYIVCSFWQAVTSGFLIVQDTVVNNRKVKVHQRHGVFDYTEWKNLRVGDIVKVEKDEFFPADLLLLSSSYDDAICYVETMNLDGETNLKLKQALEVTSDLHEDSNFRDFKAIVRCEDPNAHLYFFVGGMEFEEIQYPLSAQQVLLRDSKLRNTEYIYGAVIFAGHDTKVMQNSTDPPSKRSKIEKKTDRIIYFLFCLLFLMAFVGSVLFGIATEDDLENGRSKRWYLRPDDSTIFFDPKRAPVAALFHFLTALMLYNYFIPISLYVSIEIVKVLQTIFINQDINMYYEEGDKPAYARTSNLNEELGQVDTILSDKTGTLTCNSMEFIKCSGWDSLWSWCHRG